MELGHIMFGNNDIKSYCCPEYVVALLSDLDYELGRVMWNIHQEEWNSPFENTGESFKNDIFEVEAYSWDDTKVQPYNFKFEDIEISWYKHLRRDPSINIEISPEKAVYMYNKCLQSILEYEKQQLFEEND